MFRWNQSRSPVKPYKPQHKRQATCSSTVCRLRLPVPRDLFARIVTIGTATSGTWSVLALVLDLSASVAFFYSVGLVGVALVMSLALWQLRSLLG